MSKVKKIGFELTPGESIATVKIYQNDMVEVFKVTEDALGSLFADRFNTGYLPVSQDGVVFMEQRGTQRVVAIQRGIRNNQKIGWDDHHSRKELDVNIPWTFFLYKIKPTSDGYKIERERIYISSGSCYGANTPLYPCGWMGNVYDTPSNQNTNICWGSARVVPEGKASIGTLMNVANDFYAQDFTTHIHADKRSWEKFTQKGSFNLANMFTLQEGIRRIWDEGSF